MKLVPLVLLALAASVIVVACSTPLAPSDRPALKSGWPDAGTPASTIAMHGRGAKSWA